MKAQPQFAVEPWALCERALDLDLLDHTESVFALSNGHLGMRGTLEEGEPAVLSGTYLSGFYEERPLPYAEAGYGYPESGETVVNVTDGKLIRLLVEDEPLDMRYGRVEEHERRLDFRSGLLSRRTLWRSPTGRRVRVSSKRLVSFAVRAVAAIEYVVEPLDGDLGVVVQSELLANQPTHAVAPADPRAAAALDQPLVSDLHACGDLRAVLCHHTRNSGLRVAAGMDHVIDVPEGLLTEVEAEGDLARVTLAAQIPAGGGLRVVKLLGYGWSHQRSTPALRDQVDAALASARQLGWDGLAAKQRAYLDDVWDRVDVEIEGDDELQQAMRFALFHAVQAGARGEERAIGAKGLTGPGYDGHCFWDTETFVLPLLTYAIPDAARDALRWRHSTLPSARRRAQELGVRGAAFAWRTITGKECSAYWPAGTAAFHINAAVADATVRYLNATGDEVFEEECGVELLVETARLWRSVGHHDADGVFHVDGITGPDEYTALIDDNVYTNLMAERNLTEAAAACRRRPDVARRLGVDEQEQTAWQAAADAVAIPFDERLGVHKQCAGFTGFAEWDFDATDSDDYPLLLHHPYFELYRRQVVKQADLVLAMHLRGDAFTAGEKARNFAYYEARTVRDSSLSAGTQAVLAAEVGHLDLAFDYLGEAALVDLRDLKHNVRDGVHIASLSSAWTAAVAGFGGMRDHGGRLTFAPRLPRALSRLAFHLFFRGSRLRVEIEHEQATYTLTGGEALEIAHHGHQLRCECDMPVARPIPPTPIVAPVVQPRGRGPARREPGRARARPAGRA